MLISKVSEEVGGDGTEGGAVDGVNDFVSENHPTPEYRTASELFELMAKNSRLDSLDTSDSLTTRDLVLLYKNIDLGTKLMNDANGIKINEIVEKKPNQHVETVVYQDDQDSDSDFSEIFSAEDINNVFKINQERLDFFNDKSLENLLCPKIGGVEINSSTLSTDYDKNFLFKDPYIKKQLQNLNILGNCSQIGSVFSSSLIDYICCKRLEDNYNFYMDNIIRYVQNTIDQLKRISNGDYLTEKTKEKWREVNDNDPESNTKVLATTTSIPLHVECKNVGFATWDDIVHSEVDIRSLSKILEKKIVVEIPKLMCGSYMLYSKQCADNLIISCKREKEIEEGKESRVDVVLQLQRSQTGQVISNISSIMVLQKTQALPDLQKNILPLPYKEEEIQEQDISEEMNLNEPIVTEVKPEDDIDTQHDSAKITTHLEQIGDCQQNEDDQQHDEQHDGSLETNDYPFSEYEKENERHVSFDTYNQFSSESSIALKDILRKPKFLFPNEETYNLISPDELRITMQTLNVPSSLVEESGEDAPLRISKKKSPMRVRIKSPYENKSFLLEEKKRKRLLEIRERREKKKLALSENCKISKHKYAKGILTPQASSSVTKLSITNKSFYNSIYGQSGANIENKSLKGKYRKEQKNYSLPEQISSELTEPYESSIILTLEKSKKYINRSFYLDEAETEVMFTQKQNEIEVKNSPINSDISNEYCDYNVVTELIEPTDMKAKDKQKYVLEKQLKIEVESCDNFDKPFEAHILKDVGYLVPENTPKTVDKNQVIQETKRVTGLDCKRSIDKLYDLMKTFSKPNGRNGNKLSNSKFGTDLETANADPGSCVRGSESGTSLKQHIISNSSIENGNSYNIPIFMEKSKLVPVKKQDKKNDPSAVVPKVIISTKLQTAKVEIDKLKKDRLKTTSSPKARTENPLKAISQLLHEFDNVQKNRHNKSDQQKQLKKYETAPNDGKTFPRLNSFRRRSRFDQLNNIKENDQEKKTFRNVSPREKRAKPLTPAELARIPHQQVVIEDKVAKKKIADIIDEAKEARGEAVRGPSKTYSRLNSLAQPKRSYVQAHSEEYHSKYGRTVVADRLQRLASAPMASPATDRAQSATCRNKTRKPGDVTLTPSGKQSSSPQLDKCSRTPGLSPPRPSHPRMHSTSVGFKNIENATIGSVAIEKMVAVESYLKNHYGRSIETSLSSEVHIDGNKSRVPLIPTDFELDSITSSPTAEEANELGNRLHRMIDSMVTSFAPLTHLTECDRESKNSKSTDFSEDIFSTEQRRDSDYSIGILEDKHLKTAVENIDSKHEHSNVSINRSLSKLDVDRENSRIEMEKLENALYNQISGTFQKRLRIKNLTLTPKHSMQQVFLVQSGDAGSLLVKSTVSSIKISKSSRESLHEVEMLPVLSNKHRNWKLSQIPMQIATVGYAFPEYQNSWAPASLRIEELKVSTSSNSTGKSDKVNQCFKGVNLSHLSDSAVQVHAVNELMSLAGVVNVNPVATTRIQDENESSVFSEDCIDKNNTEGGNKNNNKVEEARCIEKSSYDEEKRITMPVQNVDINNSVHAEAIRPDNTEEEIKKPIDAITANNVPSKIKNNNFAENLNWTELTSVHSDPKNSEEVDYTTSLDMLVSILNEIQKITGQNQMAATNDDQQDRVISQNDEVNENSSKNIRSEIISMSSLENLRQLDSDTSIYSMYNLSTDENEAVQTLSKTKMDDNSNTEPREVNNETLDVKVAAVDKEVSANLPETKLCYTDISTNVSSSLITLPATNNVGVTQAIETSKPSLIKIMDYQTIFSNNLFGTEAFQNVIIDLPHADLNPQDVLVSQDKTCLNENILQSIHSQHIKKERPPVFTDMKKYCSNKFDLDPMFKIKRDILVTMYSILVFTVFAALSFPNLAFLERNDM